LKDVTASLRNCGHILHNISVKHGILKIAFLELGS